MRTGIEQILGGPVTEAIGQPGGFSPGTADRVRTSTGRAAFVKAVSPALNGHAPGIHRKEAAISASLPLTVPAPSLLGVFDDGAWVALVLSDVEGRHPHIPWRLEEITLVLDALLNLSQTPIPPGLRHLPRLEDELVDAFQGWTRIRGHLPPECDPWVLRNLGVLEQLADSGLKELSGESLVHTDVRADNILITRDNGAVLVDWPWASIGSGWIDGLTVLINVRVFDPHFDVDSILQSHDVFASATAPGVDAVLAGLAAYFIDAARQPPPPGLPTLREFQQRQGEAVIHWLRRRPSFPTSAGGSPL
ncbi:phosphotransferase [Arthrobacter sp. ISL-30]|nr:phosphotransferase [Arthrobacter sp. ISL-30]